MSTTNPGQGIAPAPLTASTSEGLSEDQIHPKLKAYFEAMGKVGASDLHLKSGRPPHVRVSSQLRNFDEPELTDQILEDMVNKLLNQDQQAIFHKFGTVDLAFELEQSDRFRINIFRQRGAISMSVRRVTRNIPELKALHLPETLHDLYQLDQGLILLAGPTGSGKSTTIASLIENINKNRRSHIITIEDPIEYLYEDKKSIVSQREIGIDVLDFKTALRSMLREDPDVILVGEMRDFETFDAALQAAETGHLVFGTIHASTGPQTISRILDLFPQESRELVLQNLAFNLRAVVCQKLLPCVKEGVDRVPAVEIMRVNPSVRQLLEEGREGELGDVIRGSEGQGMQNFTRSLYNLIEADMIDPKVAYAAASNPEDLKMMLKGISQSQAGLISRR